MTTQSFDSMINRNLAAVAASAGCDGMPIQNNVIAVSVGELLFEFASHAQWASKGGSWFRNSGHTSATSICIDAKGRICSIGSDFSRAEKDGAYPVKVFVKQSA